MKPTREKPVFKDPLNEYDTTGSVNTLKRSMTKKGRVFGFGITDCMLLGVSRIVVQVAAI